MPGASPSPSRDAAIAENERIEVIPCAQRVIRTLLAEHRRPPAARKLVNRPGWRIRSADSRLIYEIDDGRLLVVVVDAGHRRAISRER
ncbi:hypothetical protein SAMN05216329_1318 [Curtobacterium sp. YR515]|nr:hypothetical protein SAMN05216329_1318 [Curtobacterium sp. YR515]